jgi:hypothetical protein
LFYFNGIPFFVGLAAGFIAYLAPVFVGELALRLFFDRV